MLLHACAHNPTGVDPNNEEWTKIADVIEVIRPVILTENLIALEDGSTLNHTSS